MVMIGLRMRRGAFAAAGVAGAGLLAVLIPLYDAPQPRGLSVTRGRVREVADAEARKWGIPVDQAFVVTTLENSPLLDKELRGKPDLRRRADTDPVLGPRLVGFHVTYWRNGAEKNPPYGFVTVSRTGEVLAVLRQARMEEAGSRAEAGRAQAEGGRARRLAPLPGRAQSRLRGCAAERPEISHGPRLPLQGAVVVPDGRRRLLSDRDLRRRPGRRLRARRGVPGRPPLRLRHERRRDVSEVRRDLHAPLHPPRDLPEEVSRGRGRGRDGRGPVHGGHRPVPRRPRR